MTLTLFQVNRSVCRISSESDDTFFPNFQSYHFNKLTSWLDFGDFDLIFKVTGGLK